MARKTSSRPTLGLSLRDFDYALEVARQRHFGRAAQACGVSQSALSDQIRKLEERLGLTLFERTKRHVAPTPDGAPFLEQIARVLAEAERLADMAERREGRGQTLRLGAIETLGPYYLPRALKTLKSRKPDLALRLVEGKTEALVRALSAGEIDAALLATRPARGSFSFTPIFVEPFVLVAPARHPLAIADALTLDALPEPDLLLLEEGHCLRDQALALCRSKPATRHATSIETLWQMIASGEGYSLLPALAVESRPELHPLVARRPLADAAAAREIGLCWRASDPRGDEHAALAEVLKDDLPAVCLAIPGAPRARPARIALPEGAAL